jgi:uncharacterized protein YhbP (UPF0306 family)
MTIERSTRRVAAERIFAIARELLDASELCSIATVSPRQQAHVNTAYFAWDEDLTCVWLSHPSSRHSRNLRTNPSAALAVYDSDQRWGHRDRGIQVFGLAREASGRMERRALNVYTARFPKYAEGDLSAYRLYALRSRRVKVFDERTLGPGVFVTARVRSGGAVQWERTERFQGGE